MNYKSLFNQANFDGNLAIVDNLTVRDSLDISGATVSGAVSVWPELTIALNAKQDIISCTLPMQISDDTISIGYSTNLKLTGDLLDTIQDIASGSSPTFYGLNLTMLGGVAIGNYLLTTDPTSEWSNLTTALNAKQNTVTCSYPISIDANSLISIGYNSTNLKLTSNQINTIQDIASGSSPTFYGLNLTMLGGVAIGNYLLTTDPTSEWSNLTTALNAKQNTVTCSYPMSIDANSLISIGYNSTNLKLTSNQINTIQDIASGSSPTFYGLNLTTLGAHAIGKYLVDTASTGSWQNLTNALNAKQNTVTCSQPLSIDANSLISIGYNSTNLKLTSNQLNTIQDIGTGSSPTFANLNISANGKLDISNHVTASTTTASHIDMYGGDYGFSVLPATLGFVVPTSGYHRFYVNGTKRLEVSGNGISVTGDIALTSLNNVSIGNYLLSGGITGTYPIEVINNVVSLKYSSTNLKKNASDQLDTIQNIATTSSPTFSTITSSGVIKLADGSVGSPALCFSNYTSTGISVAYSAGITYFKWSVAGTERLAIRDVQLYTNFTASSFWANATDNVTALGQGGNRFTAVYAVNGTIQTSDGRMKNSITPLTLGLDFINELNPVSFKWNDTVNEGDEPIHHNRVHLGLIAQEVKQTIEDNGHTLSTTDIIDNDALIDENGFDRYGIRYSALIAPMIKAIQELTERIKYLENKFVAQ
jgi:hypothetical protein